jgi:hypothetical protein
MDKNRERKLKEISDTAFKLKTLIEDFSSYKIKETGKPILKIEVRTDTFEPVKEFPGCVYGTRRLVKTDIEEINLNLSEIADFKPLKDAIKKSEK